MSDISPRQRAAVLDRSGYRCEQVGSDEKRCELRGVEMQHRLKRSRGGKNFDRVGETRHLAHACTLHHNQADQYRMDGGFLLLGEVVPGVIEGSVVWDRLIDAPRYVGGSTEFWLADYADQRAVGGDAA